MSSRRILLIGLTVATTASLVPPAQAFPSVAGVTFACTATLTGSMSGGSGFCGNGTVPSLARVEATGYDDRGWTYIVDGLAPLWTEFQYSSACIAGEPSLFGTASGYMAVSGLGAIHNGATTHATLDVRFVWTRMGTNVLLTVTSSTIHFADGGTSTGLIGDGHATLLPMLSGTNCVSGEYGQTTLSGEVAIAS